MRRLLRAAVATVALATCALPALAQDGDGAVAEPSASAWRFESRAIDVTAMLERQHNVQGQKIVEVPLANVQMGVVVSVPGADDEPVIETRTDADGRFVLEGEMPAPGAILQFYVSRDDASGGERGYWGTPFAIDDGHPPERVLFYRVADQPPPGLMLVNVINIVTTVMRDMNDPSSKVVQLRHTAMLRNGSFEAWLGDIRNGDPTTLGIRIPEGFELRSVTVDGQRADETVVGRPGHSDTLKWLYTQPVPPSFNEPLVIQALFVAPYVEGREYDISWHNELPVARYSMDLEMGSFAYVPPGSPEQGHELVDVGVNADMGNRQISTRSFALAEIPPHQTMSARFFAGTPFPWRATLWTGGIVLLALATVLLGIAASRSRRKGLARAAEAAEAQRRVKVPTTEAARDHELDLLDRRLRRGEITSVEHQVRRAAILSAQKDVAVDRPEPRKPSSGRRHDVRDVVRDIEKRVDRASQSELRDDVRTLLAAIRDLLGER